MRGIGFKTADTIAARLGIEKTAMIRARAGIGFTLTEAMDDGHCGLPLDELVPVAERLLEIPAAIVEHALDLELEAGEVVADDVDGRCCIFLAGLHRAERGHRGLFEGTSGGRASLAPRRSGKGDSVGRARPASHSPRASGQRSTRSALEGAGHHRRSGGGQDHADQFRPQGARRQGHRDCAGGTHRARGQAAQRVLAAWPDHSPSARRRSQTRQLPAQQESPLRCDLLVVDETSMVDVPLMHAVLRAVPEHAALILVGDVDQLPSVGPGQVLADIIDSAAVPVVCLTSVSAGGRKPDHRQRPSHQPGMPDWARDPDSDFHFVPCRDAEGGREDSSRS